MIYYSNIYRQSDYFQIFWNFGIKDFLAFTLKFQDGYWLYDSTMKQIKNIFYIWEFIIILKDLKYDN